MRLDDKEAQPHWDNPKQEPDLQVIFILLASCAYNFVIIIL